jgi:putative oxidoreductase
MNLLTLFRPPAMSTRASAAMLLFRIMAGAAFILHGWGKIQHPFTWMGPDSKTPAIFQLAAALAEFVGGMAWIVGLLTPVASFFLLCTMVVAIKFAAVDYGMPFVSQTDCMTWELAAVYFCLSLVLLLGGPGLLSVDRLIFGKPATSPPPATPATGDRP